MPIEPEPAPISHSNSPPRGARVESVTARISRLVSWPSCSNSSSGSPATRGMMTRAAARNGLDRERHRRADVVHREAGSDRDAHALAWAAERFEHRQARRTEAEAVQIARDLRRRRAVPGQHDQPRAGSQMRAEELDRAGVQAQRRRFLQPPAQPRGSPGKGRGRGIATVSCGGTASANTEPAPYQNGSPEHSADHALRRDAPAASGSMPRTASPIPASACPSEATSARCRRPPTINSARPSRLARDRRKPVKPVFADADDGQPGRRHVIAAGHDILPRRNHCGS